MARDLTWQELGACNDEDPELFFPVKIAESASEPAKEVCRRCDVRLTCLNHALAIDEPNGVWGGLSEKSRRRLKKKSKSVA